MNCNAYLQKDVRICLCPKLHVKQLSVITFTVMTFTLKSPCQHINCDSTKINMLVLLKIDKLPSILEKGSEPNATLTTTSESNYWTWC